MLSEEVMCEEHMEETLWHNINLSYLNRNNSWHWQANLTGQEEPRLQILKNKGDYKLLNAERRGHIWF